MIIFLSSYMMLLPASQRKVLSIVYEAFFFFFLTTKKTMLNQLKADWSGWENRRGDRKERNPWQLEPGLALAEVVGTFIGNQVCQAGSKACTTAGFRGPSSVTAEFCASCSTLDMPRMTAPPWAPWSWEWWYIHRRAAEVMLGMLSQ